MKRYKKEPHNIDIWLFLVILHNKVFTFQTHT